MKNSDIDILKRIIGYCNDIELLKEKYNCSYENYEIKLMEIRIPAIDENR